VCSHRLAHHAAGLAADRSRDALAENPEEIEMGKSLDELDSETRPLAEQLLALATAAGLDLVVEDTGRTPDEQAGKVALGVSWTRHSLHLPQPPEGKARAIDVVPRACLSLKFWGWNGRIDNSDWRWGKLVELVESVGLHSGVHFPHPDPGHAELPLPRTMSA
jgi:hypothetical protein